MKNIYNNIFEQKFSTYNVYYKFIFILYVCTLYYVNDKEE